MIISSDFRGILNIPYSFQSQVNISVKVGQIKPYAIASTHIPNMSRMLKLFK